MPVIICWSMQYKSGCWCTWQRIHNRSPWQFVPASNNRHRRRRSYMVGVDQGQGN